MADGKDGNDVKELLVEFADKTSFNAIPHIVKSKHKLLTCLWLFVLVGGTLMLTWNLYLNVTDYLEYSINSLFTEGIGRPVFPDLTFCNIYQLNDSDGTKDLTWEKYRFLSFIRENEVYNDETFRRKLDLDKLLLWEDEEFMERLNSMKRKNSKEYEEEVKTRIVKNLEFVLDDFQDPALYFANLPIDIDRRYDSSNDQMPRLFPLCEFYMWDGSVKNCLEYIHEIWNPDYNKCYTVRPDSMEDRREIYGLSAILYINNFPAHQASSFSTYLGQTKATGVRLSIHSPGTKPRLSSGFSISPGTESMISIVPMNRTRLGKPYSDTDCTEEVHLEGSDTVYTYEACGDVCFQELVMKQCGCLHGRAEFTRDQFDRVGGRLCGNQSLYEIEEELRRSKKWRVDDIDVEFVKTFLSDDRAVRSVNELICLYYTDFDSDDCDTKCLLPCKQYKYTSSISSASWPHIYYHMAFYERFLMNRSDIYGDKFAVYEDLWKKATTFDSNDGLNKYVSSEHDLTDRVQRIDLIGRNFLQVTVKFDDRKPFVLTDTAKYTWDSVLGLFGGTVGLWSGLSIMAAVELIDLVYTLTYHYWRLLKKRAPKSNEVTGVRECPPENEAKLLQNPPPNIV